MSALTQIQHRYVRQTNFPYQVATGPSDGQLRWVGGTNVLTSYKGYAERRPGFSATEGTPTTFTSPPRRVFTWRRWGGAFFIMANVVSATQSIIYKLQVGVDASFVSIFTSSSAEPFDFLVANNYVFFGNGTDMRKWDGTTVTNWGIAAPTVAPTSNLRRSLLTPTAAAGTNWTNPNNALTLDATYAVYNNTAQDLLRLTVLSAAIPTNATITGFEVLVTGNGTSASVADRTIGVGFTKNGTALAGTTVSATLNQTTDTTLTVGAYNNLFGTTWTPAEVNASTFGAVIQDGDITAAALNIDFVQVRVYYRVSAGITAANGGYKYVYCYGSSTSGHVSSPSSETITATGNFSTATEVEVSVTVSTDAQVDRIHIFRTTDGGGGIWFEISGSPFTNVTSAKVDTTADASLSTATVPVGGFNDPPPASRGFVWYANRLWMYVNNRVWFTGWEEINVGVAEESVPSGVAGNYWAFDSEVTGLSAVEDGVLVFTAGRIYKIEGDSLDTFRRLKLADNLGCRERAAIAKLGKVIAFLSAGRQVWITDGRQITEVSKPIQSDLDGIDHTQVSLAFHVNEQQRWLCLLDGANSRLRVYDVEREVWMPPWTVGGRSVHSGETAAGTWKLFVGHSGGKVLEMTPALYVDDGSAYSATAITSLFDIVPDSAPGHLSKLEYFALERNEFAPTDVLQLTDDNSQEAAASLFVSVVQNKRTPPERSQGVKLQEDWYWSRQPAARRVALKLNWPTDNNNFKLYGFDIAYRVLR